MIKTKRLTPIQMNATQIEIENLEKSCDLRRLIDDTLSDAEVVAEIKKFRRLLTLRTLSCTRTKNDYHIEILLDAMERQYAMKREDVGP